MFVFVVDVLFYRGNIISTFYYRLPHPRKETAQCSFRHDVDCRGLQNSEQENDRTSDLYVIIPDMITQVRHSIA